jgi:L-serine dehydratase
MKTLSFPSIFNDVIGPVMRGPSSSHTAASWRIAIISMQLLDDELKEALVEFDKDGAWAPNFREQGTCMGIGGGLLGIDITDERIIDPESVASERGVHIQYSVSSFSTDHANTVRLRLSGKSGRTIQVQAVSTGGGMFEIRQYNDEACSIEGDNYQLFIHVNGSFGQAEFEALQAMFPGNDVGGKSDGGEESLIQVRSSGAVPDAVRAMLEALPGVGRCIAVDPVLPILSGRGLDFPFSDVETMLLYASETNISLGKAGLIYEACRSGLPEQALKDKMKEIISIIETAIDEGLKGTDYRDRILQQQSDLIRKAEGKELIGSGNLVNRIIENITALMEAKSAMHVIVAVPTAGSCGTFGGTVKAFCDVNGIGEEEKILAYFAGGLMGAFFAGGPGFSAEEYGCQVETGAAATMAAAALVELSAGNAAQAVGAASMALQNSMGLVCDPVADRVEVPCLGKNVTAGMNALGASTMALSGFNAVIPFDQVLDAAASVGKCMPSALRCTGRGGLSVSPKSVEIKKKLGKNGRS